MPSAARCYALPMIAAKADRNFDHGRDDGNALCVIHDVVRDGFVWSGHDFIQDVSGIVDALGDVGLIVCAPAQAGTDQSHGA